jgi:cytochrome c-type biogenesis protein
MTPDLPQVSWGLAFLAGAVSFLSPCVVPLIPGYLSYVSGVSVDDLHAGAPGLAGRVLGQSLLFVAGFALVFVALGASASAAGVFLAEYRDILNRVSGVFIIAMGLSLLGLLRVGALSKEHRLSRGTTWSSRIDSDSGDRMAGRPW